MRGPLQVMLLTLAAGGFAACAVAEPETASAPDVAVRFEVLERREDAEKEQRDHEGELSMLESRIEKYKDQLMNVKSNDEYKAMQRQSDDVQIDAPQNSSSSGYAQPFGGGGFPHPDLGDISGYRDVQSAPMLDRRQFRAIGHSLFALMFAIIGGVVGQWFEKRKT